MSQRDFAPPGKRGRGRPPLAKGKGGPTYVPRTDNDSPIRTPPRSPSEASLASSRDINSDGVLSPLNSPPPGVVLPPAPVPQQLPIIPQARSLPPTPVNGLNAPFVPPPAAKQPQQPVVAANVASPSEQEMAQLRQRVENIAESNRRHGLMLGENATAIRQLRESVGESNRLLSQLLDRSDQIASTRADNRSAPASRSNNFSNENNTNVRPNNNTGVLNAQLNPQEPVRKVTEDKHIPQVLKVIKSPVNEDIVSWIEKLQSIARNQKWSDADIRQVFLFRTGGTLNNFLFGEIEISTMTFAQIVNAIFRKWNNIDRLMINTRKLQNTRMQDGETVETYYERFIEVAGRVTNKSDFDKMILFVDGLSEELREQIVKNSQPKDLDSAYTAAQNAESWKSLFPAKKQAVKKETIYQVVRPINSQRPFTPASGSYQGNFSPQSPGSFNTPRPFSPRPTPMNSAPTPKTPAPAPSNWKSNNSSAVRRLNFSTPQHNNIDDPDPADVAMSNGPQEEFNNMEETLYVVEEDAPEPGNDLLEEH